MTNENTSKSIAILNTTPPFAKTNGKDALDAALIFGSLEQKVSLFFHGDGVWQLLNNQNPSLIQTKNYLKTFAAFEFYDIENVYVCEDSLRKRKLQHDFHIENIKVLDLPSFKKQLSSHAVIYRF